MRLNEGVRIKCIKTIWLIECPRPWSPTFLMPGTGFMENSFSTDRYKIGGMGAGGGGLG